MKISFTSAELVPGLELISKITGIDTTRFVKDIGTAKLSGDLTITDTVAATSTTPAYTLTLEIIID